MENPPSSSIPDLAIFQNSQTMRSAVWTKELGRWHECDREEYPAMLLLVTLLRNSPDPDKTMKEIITMMRFGL